MSGHTNGLNSKNLVSTKGADFYEFHSRLKLNGVPLPFSAGVGIQLKYVSSLNT